MSIVQFKDDVPTENGKVSKSRKQVDLEAKIRDLREERAKIRANLMTAIADRDQPGQPKQIASFESEIENLSSEITTLRSELHPLAAAYKARAELALAPNKRKILLRIEALLDQSMSELESFISHEVDATGTSDERLMSLMKAVGQGRQTLKKIVG